MTTIAWDGYSVAADTMMIFGGYRSPGRVTKIRRSGDKAFALTGYAAWYEAWIKWYEDGADPKSVPVCNTEKESTGLLIVFKEGKALCFTSTCPYPCEEHAPNAWGVGAEFAIGAMKAGASAVRAVEIAIECSPWTGGEVDTIDLSLQTLKAAA